MAKTLVQSFYSQTIQSTMTTSSTSVNVDVAPANTVGYAVLENGESNQELIKWQGVTSLTLTSLLRGLSLTATTDTEVAGNKKTHAINDTIQQTVDHYILNDKVSNEAEETIAGLKTFTLAPKSSAAASATTELMRYDETCRLTGDQTVAGVKTFSSVPLCASAPTTGNHLCNKTYVDDKPAAALRFTYYYAGEDLTNRNSIAKEPLSNTDGGSDADFGRDSASNGVYQAQSFVAGSTASSFSMTVSLKKQGSPADNVYIEIQGDNSGSPDGTPVTNGTSDDVSGATIGASYTDISFAWSSDPTLVAGTTYWLVLKRDGANSDSAYYQAEYANNNAFVAGKAMKYTTAWVYNTDADDDLVFEISGVEATAIKAKDETYNSSRRRLGFLGFANAAASKGDTIEIQNFGRMTGFTGLTADTPYYIDSTAGALTTTSTNPIAGVAINATTMYVLRTDIFITSTQATTLTGGGDANTLHTHDANIETLTAGENVDGSSTPVAVYISDGTNSRTSGRYYKTDCNDSSNTDSPKFFGFAKGNKSTDETDDIHYSGIVGGFTGLTVGADYYLSDTAGAISTTPSTTKPIKIGKAISATQILIEKEANVYASSLQSDLGGASTANVDTEIECGFRPTVIRVDYKLNGYEGADKYTVGYCDFMGTVAKGGMNFTDNAINTDVYTSTVTPNVVTIEAGNNNANNMKVTLTITAISDTSVTVRLAYSADGGYAQGNKTQLFRITAYK